MKITAQAKKNHRDIGNRHPIPQIWRKIQCVYLGTSTERYRLCDDDNQKHSDNNSQTNCNHSTKICQRLLEKD